MDERDYKIKKRIKRRRRKRLRIAYMAACVTLTAGFIYIWSVKHSKNNYVNAYESTTNQSFTADTSKPEDILAGPKLPEKVLSKAGISTKTPTAGNMVENDNTNVVNTSTPMTENPPSDEPKAVPPDADSQDSAMTGKYQYGTPLPESEAVGSEYFDDAVFIGNSHTEGIISYSAMDNATVYASKGLTIDSISTSPVIKTAAGRVSITAALASGKFAKVYILLGANELGWVYPSEFIRHYSNFIDTVRELQPDAKIYIQSIFPVSADKDSQGTVYNNANISKYNGLIADMARDKEVYYLNVAEALADEEGNLPDDCAKDGMHFGKKYYDKWFDYLKCHTAEGMESIGEAE